MDIFNGLARFYDWTKGEYIFVSLDWLKKHKPNHYLAFEKKEEVIVDYYTLAHSTKPADLQEEIEKTSIGEN